MISIGGTCTSLLAAGSSFGGSVTDVEVDIDPLARAKVGLAGKLGCSLAAVCQNLPFLTGVLIGAEFSTSGEMIFAISPIHPNAPLSLISIAFSQLATPLTTASSYTPTQI